MSKKLNEIYSYGDSAGISVFSEIFFEARWVISAFGVFLTFVNSYVIVYKYHSIFKIYLQSNIIVYF